MHFVPFVSVLLVLLAGVNNGVESQAAAPGVPGAPGTLGPLGGSPYSASVISNAVKPGGSQSYHPYALSSVYLKDLAERELLVHERVLEYLKHLEDRMGIVKQYLSDFAESNAGVEVEEGLNNIKLTEIEARYQNGSDLTLEEKALRVTASPLRSFRMIRRFAREFTEIDKHIRDDAEATLLNEIAEIQGNYYSWPSNDDTYDVMDGLLRIHFFYKLNLTDFVEGKVDNLETGAKFTTQQCWEIAQFGIKWKFYTLAMEWLQVTRWKLSKEGPDSVPGLSDDIIRAAERKLRDQHDKNFDQQREERSPFIYSTEIGSGPELPITMREHLFRNYLGKEWAEHSDYSFINYVALCNGHNFQPAEEKLKLKCWYEKDKHPYFRINPLKMELLNEYPYLVQVYDFVGDKWIEVFKRVASPMLERAPPRQGKATPRTATYAWLSDEHIAETEFIKKAEAFTGIHVATERASERLQIASYTFGGHVGTHVDSLGISNAALDEKGDRIFTLLVYLNDVERGGLTAFPILGTTVQPQKGAAVLWYDSLKNGEIDGRMLHGACPLIYGQKWIATKWTHLNENMFAWPCSLNPEE